MTAAEARARASSADVGRLQLDLTRNRIAELDELAEVCGLSTRKELFNNALTMFEWAVHEVQNGNTIASVDEEERRYKELQMPALARAARRGQWAVAG